MAATHAAAFTGTRSWTVQEFENLLDNGASAIGDAQCFALIRVVLDEVELLTIATHPMVQRQGRARAIMHEWLAQARKRGVTSAFLEVAADNTPAIALYHLFGFATAGVRPDYYRLDGGRRADALVMALSLTNT